MELPFPYLARQLGGAGRGARQQIRPETTLSNLCTVRISSVFSSALSSSGIPPGS